MPAEADVTRFVVIKTNEDGRILDFQEKPMMAESNTISCGIYIIRRRQLIELLERCAQEDDWVRAEIEHAMAKNKNIIPVMLRNFSFPEKLPESIEKLRYQNGVESNFQFFDAFLEKLTGFLKSRPDKGGLILHRLRHGKRLILTGMLILALAAGLGFLLWKQFNNYPRTARDRNLTNELIYYVEKNMTQMEQAAGYLDEVYHSCSQYLAHYETADYSSLLAQLQTNRRRLYQIDLEDSLMTESLRQQLQNSRFGSEVFR